MNVLFASALLPLAFGHGDEMEGHGMDHGDKGDYPPTYFTHPEYRDLGFAHIALMAMTWVFILPTSVMLSLARSRYALPSQLVFITMHTLGLVLGIAYNSNTPDLYPNNAHHKLGWIVTIVVGGHVLLSLLGRVASPLRRALRRSEAHAEQELQTFIPMTKSAMAEHQRLQGKTVRKPNRHSNDSGHGTEGNTESVRSNSISTVAEDSPPPGLEEGRKVFDMDDDVFDDVDMLSGKGIRGQRSYSGKVATVFSSHALRIFSIWYRIVDRVVLLLGFITLCTGIATYGRFFEGSGIFSGLAHWIKGGIFSWMGIFTLGRWSGAFGELGWAWNVRPRRSARGWRPSAEFVESALIFAYGTTNIFLEHLGGWGGEWTAQDLEHISITVLFIGGGLCGMLIESTHIRNLLNTTVKDAATESSSPPDVTQRGGLDTEKKDDDNPLKEPDQYGFSLNPIPALVIVLLGIMMSSHAQASMVSSMVHKQWGNLLLGGSLARFLTYVLVFLKPPRSVLPSRPPTELLAAFGLTAGGIIFMASASDTIAGMEHFGLDAMFFYTVTMGMVGLVMAWVILLLALKGWAVRREARLRQKVSGVGQV